MAGLSPSPPSTLETGTRVSVTLPWLSFPKCPGRAHPQWLAAVPKLCSAGPVWWVVAAGVRPGSLLSPRECTDP